MGRKVTIACVSLNQWAMDFYGNMKRIKESIKQAKEKGARLRCGQELEICGYSCSDHFMEHDTFLHSWEVLAKIMLDPNSEDILCSVGMPVMYKSVAYNCQVFFLNKEILLIRPKMILADDGNYRESRWFTRWTKDRETEDFQLPIVIKTIMNQRFAPIGDALIQTADACIAAEICEEMWAVQSRHIELSLDGAEIIINGSCSYHQLRKLNLRVNMVKSSSKKAGGVFVFSNGIGCDGERVFWDGGANVFINGKCVAQGPQFSLQEVNVITAVVDLDDVETYRNSIKSRCTQASMTKKFPRINTEFLLETDESLNESKEIDFQFLDAVDEIRLGPACWLWDYLRRSGQGGFFLPLSGGIDSSATACIVASMCNLVCEAVDQGDESVIADVRKITSIDNYTPSDPSELANQLFTTCYMASTNSSQDTKNRAKTLAEQIGSYHFGIVIDTAVDAILGIFKATTKMMPKFKANNGSPRENLALQNVQARVRMVLSYLFAQLSLWARGRQGGLLVLGSANVDESLRGYLTKYDCSSADINPIGGISKTDLRSFIKHCHEMFEFTALESIYNAPPTAELEPLENGAIAQTDEDDMGMTYEELSEYGKMRKQNFCGPFSMFCKLIDQKGDHLPPEKIFEKVKHFFYTYSVNRHKMTVLTPSYHCESYSPDDNRFDQRQFLYNTRWHWQTLRIKAEVSKMIERPIQNTDESHNNVNVKYEGQHPSHVNSTGEGVAKSVVSVLPPSSQHAMTMSTRSSTNQQPFVMVTRDPHKRMHTSPTDGVDGKKPREGVLLDVRD